MLGPGATPSLLLLPNRKWDWTCGRGFPGATPTTNFFRTVYWQRWSPSFAGTPPSGLVKVGVKGVNCTACGSEITCASSTASATSASKIAGVSKSQVRVILLTRSYVISTY